MFFFYHSIILLLVDKLREILLDSVLFSFFPFDGFFLFQFYFL